MSEHRAVKAYMVAAGKYHDIDHARLELLKLLAEDERIRVQVAADYHDLEAIGESDFLITYTCDLVPTDDEQVALRDYVASGKSWFALHGTNAILRFEDDGRVGTPDVAPVLMETLGSQFVAHPPIQPFTVSAADPEHELVKGIGEFEADDELYLSREYGELHVLLKTHFTGDASSFVEGDASNWQEDEPRPVYYINKVGDGEVLFLNLGHSRGHYDMQPLMDYYPEIERGSWKREEFYELLRRGIRYCVDRIAA